MHVCNCKFLTVCKFPAVKVLETLSACSKAPGKTSDMILNPSVAILSETLSFPQQFDNCITSNSNQQ